MRTRNLLIAIGLIALNACSVARAEGTGPHADSTATLAAAADAPTLVAPAAVDAPVAPVALVDLSQTTRPADSVLFAEMQVSLKSLAWRATDGKFRATNRDNGAGPWESDVRDAVWKGLFYTPQGAAPQ